MKQFSMIRPKVKKRLLIKGMTLSFVGITFLIGMGTFATIDTLSIWGAPSFFFAIFLIGMGLIPYRSLTRLETHPHQLILEKNHLIFISTRGNQVAISYQQIKNISHVETKSCYGIRLELEKKKPLFLPYFSNNSSLNEIVHSNQSNEAI